MEPLRISNRSAHVLAILFLLGILAFLTISVIEPGNLANLDLKIAHFFHETENPLGIKVFGIITYFGNAFVIGILTVLAALVFWFSSPVRKAHTLGLIAAVGSSALISYSMKIFVHRARPLEIASGFVETSFSFPSGHATVSTALYGFLLYLLFLNASKTTRHYIAALLLIGLIFAIGLSRLYLGVHFMSDVIAGFALGILGIFIGRAVARRWEPISENEPLSTK